MAITILRPGIIKAELSMSLTHILLFLPTARRTGLEGTMVVLSLPSDFRLEAMCQPQDRRKESSHHATCCLLFLHCSQQWGTFWTFLTSAKIHRSVVQHCCCVMHIMQEHAGICPHGGQYRKAWMRNGRKGGTKLGIKNNMATGWGRGSGDWQ